MAKNKTAVFKKLSHKIYLRCTLMHSMHIKMPVQQKCNCIFKFFILQVISNILYTKVQYAQEYTK